jgi:hypothetical protein
MAIHIPSLGGTDCAKRNNKMMVGISRPTRRAHRITDEEPKIASDPLHNFPERATDISELATIRKRGQETRKGQKMNEQLEDPEIECFARCQRC